MSETIDYDALQTAAYRETQARGCDHVWIETGGPDDEWHECDLCGAKEDR